MAEIPPVIQRYIQSVTAQISPRSLFELSPTPGIATDHCRIAQHQRYTLTESFNWTSVNSTATVELAVVIDAPCYLRRIDVEHLLAYLRNSGAQSILVIHTGDTRRHREPWQIRDFLALGFRRAERAEQLSATHQVYRYDIHNYKLTPDWLSASNWANPERWGKERW